MEPRSVLIDGARGGSVTILGQAGKLVVQVVSVVLLSRLLEPADFGLVAMVTVFVALGDLLRDFGLSTAALEVPKLGQQQASNMFWMSTALGLSAGLLLTAATPLLVLFYHEPRLAAITPVLAIGLLLNGLQAQVQVHLARSLRFTTLALTDLSSQAVALAVAASAAFLGLGFWALVLQVLTNSLLLLATRFISARWLPSRPARNAGTAPLIRKGVHYGASQLLTYAAANVDTMVIGSQWGSTQLGFYNRAYQLLATPLNAMLGPLTNVVVPVVNRARTEGRTVDSVLLRVQFSVAFMAVWLYVVAFSASNEIIPWLLGPGWEESIALFRILAIGGMIQVFSYVSYWAFILHDLSRQLLIYNIVSKGIVVTLLVLAGSVGVEAVAWAYSLGQAVSWPINLYWLAKHSSQDSWKFLRNGARILGAALASLVLTPALLSAVREPLILAVSSILLSSALFIGALLALPRGRHELGSFTRTVRLLIKQGRG